MLLVVGGTLALLRSLPPLGDVEQRARGTTDFMRWRARQMDDPVDAYRILWTPTSEIPAVLLCAIVAAEDKRFFRHAGIDWVATRRALLGALGGGDRVGASTLTQQLARNLYLTGERSIARKLREMLLARRLEAQLDKREILTLYVNRIEWARGVWGVGAASRHHFGKPPPELSPAEIAHLTALIAAPTSRLEGDALDGYRRRATFTLRRLYRWRVLGDETIRDLTGWNVPPSVAIEPDALLASSCGSLDVAHHAPGPAR